MRNPDLIEFEWRSAGKAVLDALGRLQQAEQSLRNALELADDVDLPHDLETVEIAEQLLALKARINSRLVQLWNPNPEDWPVLTTDDKSGRLVAETEKNEEGQS